MSSSVPNPHRRHFVRAATSKDVEIGRAYIGELRDILISCTRVIRDTVLATPDRYVSSDMSREFEELERRIGYFRELQRSPLWNKLVPEVKDQFLEISKLVDLTEVKRRKLIDGVKYETRRRFPNQVISSSRMIQEELIGPISRNLGINVDASLEQFIIGEVYDRFEYPGMYEAYALKGTNPLHDLDTILFEAERDIAEEFRRRDDYLLRGHMVNILMEKLPERFDFFRGNKGFTLIERWEKETGEVLRSSHVYPTVDGKKNKGLVPAFKHGYENQRLKDVERFLARMAAKDFLQTIHEHGYATFDGARTCVASNMVPNSTAAFGYRGVHSVQPFTAEELIIKLAENDVVRRKPGTGYAYTLTPRMKRIVANRGPHIFKSDEILYS